MSPTATYRTRWLRVAVLVALPPLLLAAASSLHEDGFSWLVAGPVAVVLYLAARSVVAGVRVTPTALRISGEVWTREVPRADVVGVQIGRTYNGWPVAELVLRDGGTRQAIGLMTGRVTPGYEEKLRRLALDAGTTYLGDRRGPR